MFCRQHDREMTPLYHRPKTDSGSRTFQRAEYLYYCPGDAEGNGAHIRAEGDYLVYGDRHEYDLEALRRGKYKLIDPEGTDGGGL